MDQHEPDRKYQRIDLMQLYGDDGTPVLKRVHEMIAEYAFAHSAITVLLYELEHDLRSNRIKQDDAIIKLYNEIMPKCGSYLLPETERLIDITIHRYNEKYITDLIPEIFHIINKASDEGQKLMLFPVNPDRVKYYCQKKLFGDNIFEKFPDAQPDLTEAGNCYALECWTACVLHLMRALESTLRSIGTSLKGFTYISANPTATMGQISTELKKYADSLPRKTARDLDFKDKLHAAAMHFKDITNAIRNKTAHTGKFYSSEQAHFILVATEQFLNDLVDIVKIPRRRK